jgi:hypothetical protein
LLDDFLIAGEEDSLDNELLLVTLQSFILASNSQTSTPTPRTGFPGTPAEGKSWHSTWDLQNPHTGEGAITQGALNLHINGPNGQNAEVKVKALV